MELQLITKSAILKMPKFIQIKPEQFLMYLAHTMETTQMITYALNKKKTHVLTLSISLKLNSLTTSWKVVLKWEELFHSIDMVSRKSRINNSFKVFWMKLLFGFQQYSLISTFQVIWYLKVMKLSQVKSLLMVMIQKGFFTHLIKTTVLCIIQISLTTVLGHSIYTMLFGTITLSSRHMKTPNLKSNKEVT